MASRILPFKQPSTKYDKRRALRVLVVDDEEPMRRFVDQVMQSAGFETSLAADGDEALALAANSPSFDLLITDEVMPRLAGHQLARYMRERYRGIKVLYISGYRDELFKEKGSLWADEAFLEKPFNPDGLTDAVSQLLFGALTNTSPENHERS
jgi:two-component system, cell cycle sensor histidine kinase and response regulator CckA